jgi:hypothetical protein
MCHDATCKCSDCMRGSKAGGLSTYAEVRIILIFVVERASQSEILSQENLGMALQRWIFGNPFRLPRGFLTQLQCLTVQMLPRSLTSLLGRAAPFAAPRPCLRCFTEAGARYGDQAHFKTEVVFGKKHAGFDRSGGHKNAPGKRPSIPRREGGFSQIIEDTEDREVMVRHGRSCSTSSTNQL